MAKFNAYSFCKAHAASYAALAWVVAYLKTHFPMEFWVSALNNNQSMYHPRVYVEQAKRGGIVFCLPDVNRSGREFIIDGDGVRVGLNFVCGLGPVSADRILNERERRLFSGIGDFLTRTRLGEPEIRSLILCGAFDFLGRTRPELMMEMNLCPRATGKVASNQGQLLAAVPDVPHGVRDYSAARKYADEKRILGISVGPHIMSIRRRHLGDRVDADSRRLAAMVGGHVRIAGVLEAIRTATTQRGGKMIFLTLDDEFGLFEVTIFPNVRKRTRAAFNYQGTYIVSGRVQEQYGTVTITADSVSFWRDETARVAS